MALEPGNYIGDLVVTNPTPADPKSAGDDHLRLLKTALRQCFPGFPGSILLGGDATAVADAYTLTPATALLAYSPGMMVVFKAPSANGGVAPTLKVSALDAKPIRAVDGAPLAAGDLLAGQYIALTYDGTVFRLAAVTKRYIDGLAFQTALPGQPMDGQAYGLYSQNGAGAWRQPSIFDYPVALAQLQAGALSF